MMTSKGTSRLMATWTGAIPNRLNACGLVLGKPSSSQLRSADDRRFSSPPTIFSMSSSGTSCPFETNLTTTHNRSRHRTFAHEPHLHTYLSTCTPRSVFCRIMLRNTSPLDMCSMSNDRTMRSDTVPLPEPGAPMIRACSLFIAGAADGVKVERRVLAGGRVVDGRERVGSGGALLCGRVVTAETISLASHAEARVATHARTTRKRGLQNDVYLLNVCPPKPPSGSAAAPCPGDKANDSDYTRPLQP